MFQRSRPLTRTRFVSLIAVAALSLSGCSAAATPSPEPSASTQPSPGSGPSEPPSAAPSDLPSASPSVTPSAAQSEVPSAEPTNSAEPTPSDAPTPTPTPALPPATGWSNPVRIAGSAGCAEDSLGIDASSRVHVAGDCANGVYYAARNPDSTWAGVSFASPANRTDLGSQLAFDGGVVYLAYYQISDGACGGPLATGVYYRTKTNGTWSAPTRFGALGDELETFRVENGTLLATVSNGDSKFFETVHGGRLHRYPIADAEPAGVVSLRLGSDGLPRIAYWSPAGIRYGVFNGTGFTTTTVIKQDGYVWQPNLVLDASNNPRFLWTHSPAPGGCVTTDPTPLDGTYYATDQGGTWTSSRFTTDVGDTSLQLDNGSGEAYALVTSDGGVDEFTRSPAGSWTANRLVGLDAQNPVLRRDPATGALLVALTVYSGESVPPGIYVMTKPGN